MRPSPSPSRRVRTVLAAVTPAAALSACGGGNDSTVAAGVRAAEPSPSVSASPAPGGYAEHNDQDIAFITDMKPRYGGGIETAGLAATRAHSSAVKDLAERIVAAQDSEIATMQQMATAGGVDLDAAGTNPHGDMDALERLSGAAPNQAFLNSLTVHYSSAVETVEQEVAGGLDTQAKQMAQDTATSLISETAR